MPDTTQLFDLEGLIDGTRRPAVIEVTRRLVDGFHRYDVEVEVEGRSFRGEARDAFAAFAECRRQFEPLGIRVLVEGARRDTYPSGMLRDMAGGLRVYREVPGVHPERGDTLGTFAVSCEAIVTVAEQRAAHEAWMESFG